MAIIVHGCSDPKLLSELDMTLEKALFIGRNLENGKLREKSFAYH